MVDQKRLAPDSYAFRGKGGWWVGVHAIPSHDLATRTASVCCEARADIVEVLDLLRRTPGRIVIRLPLRHSTTSQLSTTAPQHPSLIPLRSWQGSQAKAPASPGSTLSKSTGTKHLKNVSKRRFFQAYPDENGFYRIPTSPPRWYIECSLGLHRA